MMLENIEGTGALYMRREAWTASTYLLRRQSRWGDRFIRGFCSFLLFRSFFFLPLPPPFFLKATFGKQ